MGEKVAVKKPGFIGRQHHVGRTGRGHIVHAGMKAHPRQPTVKNMYRMPKQNAHPENHVLYIARALVKRSALPPDRAAQHGRRTAKGIVKPVEQTQPVMGGPVGLYIEPAVIDRGQTARTTAIVHDLHPAEDHGATLVRVKPGCLTRKLVRQPGVIGTNHGHIPAPGPAQQVVGRAGGMNVFRQRLHTDARIVKALHDGKGSIRGTIVKNEKFKIRKGLPQHGSHGRAHKGGMVVTHHADRNFGRMRTVAVHAVT